MPSARRGGWVIPGLVFGIALCAATPGVAISPCPTCVPPGPPVDAGSNVRRDILPAVFQIVLDPEVAQATVTVVLGEAAMNGITLDYRRPVVPFSVSAGPCNVTGTLMLRLNDTPDVSAIYIDSSVSGPNDPAACAAAAPPAPSNPARAFRGDLVQWRTPISIALLRDRHFLTANLSVQVDVVRGQVDDQAIDLSFFNGAQLIWSAPVTSASAVTLNQDVGVGQTTIRKGARFTIIVPSPVSQGQLNAQNLTIVTGTTLVDASGILSSWPVAPAPAPPGASGPSLSAQAGVH